MGIDSAMPLVPHLEHMASFDAMAWSMELAMAVDAVRVSRSDWTVLHDECHIYIYIYIYIYHRVWCYAWYRRRNVCAQFLL